MTEPIQNDRQVCAVTGSGGYVGGIALRHFLRSGWQVREFTRSPGSAADAVAFQLGEDVADSAFQGVGALVHCAYDFTGSSWDSIREINVLGSEKLFRAAREAGVREMVCVSTISAFEGCKSLYGKAKLEIERIAHEYGALVIRPGLVYGTTSGGMFGRLVQQVRNSQLQPLVGGGRQVQYLIHEEDLAELMVAYCNGRISVEKEACLTAAHPAPWTLRALLEGGASSEHRKLQFIPIPWQPVWLALRIAESLGIRLAFRSDSLISLVNQNPFPQFPDFKRLGWQPRAFPFASRDKEDGLRD